MLPSLEAFDAPHSPARIEILSPGIARARQCGQRGAGRRPIPSSAMPDPTPEILEPHHRYLTVSTQVRTAEDNMDEMMWLRMFGGFGSGVDLTALLAFVAFGVVAFLAPVVGYRPGRSGGVTASLYLLVGYVGVSVLQLLMLWLQLDRSSGGSGGGSVGRGGEVSIVFAFALMKMVLFLGAMLLFAIGVGNFRLPAVRKDAS
jgi:hypothetical protein